MKKLLTILFILIIIIGAVWYGVSRNARTPANTQPGTGEPAVGQDRGITVSYACNEGKTITATLYNGPTIQPTTPGNPPIPGGSAHVVLSDGRTLDLKQTISADGVRYSNGDPSILQGKPGAESFVFWSKGDGALVLENNVEKSYIGCVQTTVSR